MKAFLRIFRAAGKPDEAAERRLAEALEASRRRLAAVPPDTMAQWMRLDRAMESVPAAPALRTPRPALRYGLAAASLALVVVSLLFLRGGHPSTERFATGRAEQLHILLPDSSEVVLSHTTSLSFDRDHFTTTRAVTLEGEAYFTVRKTGSPFVVSSGAASAAVLGTEFNMMVRDARYEVGVTQGAVQVRSASQTGDTTVVLRAGELLTGARGGGAGLRSVGSPDAYPGWRHARLLADKASLRSICREIEDRFNVRVEVRRPSDQTVSGLITGADAASMVATLARLLDCNYRYEDGTYTLY